MDQNCTLAHETCVRVSSIPTSSQNSQHSYNMRFCRHPHYFTPTPCRTWTPKITTRLDLNEFIQHNDNANLYSSPQFEIHGEVFRLDLHTHARQTSSNEESYAAIQLIRVHFDRRPHALEAVLEMNSNDCPRMQATHRLESNEDFTKLWYSTISNRLLQHMNDVQIDVTLQLRVPKTGVYSQENVRVQTVGQAVQHEVIFE